MTTATAERAVRVTIEGTARPVKHDSRYLYVEAVGQHLLINAEALGVTVEDVTPGRVWTDGDVVQSDHFTYSRREGAWIVAGIDIDHKIQDETITRDVASHGMRVLRYQAGEQ